MTIEQIYQGAAELINKLIRDEIIAQGHTATGRMADSLENKIIKTKQTATLEGYGIDYMKIIDEGIEPEQVSFSMLPKLILYFRSKGFDEANAKKAAVNTIKKWTREGLPTQASKRFSTTGNRKNFIEAAFTRADLDIYMSNSFDQGVHEEYSKTKSETI